MSAANAGAAVAADCVNFIDKDDRRSVFLRLIEQVTDTGRTDTHEHFHEIRTGNGEERAAGFSCNSSRQQSLTGSGRSHEQYALGDTGTQFRILPRIFQEVYNFFQFMLFLIGTCHIGKGCLASVRLILDVCLAEGGVLAAAVCLPHHEHEQEDHQPQQHQCGNQRQQPRSIPNLIIVHLQRSIGVLLVIAGAIVLRIITEYRYIGHIIGQLIPVVQRQLQFAGAQIQGVRSDFIIIKVLHNVGIFGFFAAGFQPVQQENQCHDQYHDNEQIRSDPTAFLWCQITFTPFC